MRLDDTYREFGELLVQNHAIFGNVLPTHQSVRFVGLSLFVIDLFALPLAWSE